MHDTARCASAPGGANARQNGGHAPRRRPPLYQIPAVRGQLSFRGLYYNANGVYRLAEYNLFVKFILLRNTFSCRGTIARQGLMLNCRRRSPSSTHSIKIQGKSKKKIPLTFRNSRNLVENLKRRETRPRTRHEARRCRVSPSKDMYIVGVRDNVRAL